MTSVERVDVAVIGAGFAGLAAARRLRAAGASVRVLEARDRVGGRAVNLPVGPGAITEGGAQYIGPTQDRLRALADAYQVARFPSHTAGTFHLSWQGRPVGVDVFTSSPECDLAALVDSLQSLAAEVPVDAPWRAPRSAQWDARTLGDWLEATARTALGRDILLAMCRILFGAEAGAVSLLFALHYIAAAGNETTPGSLTRLIGTENGAQAERFVGGSQLIAQRIADELGECLSLDSPVRRIDYAGRDAVVRTDRDTVRAGAVVVAIPPPTAARIGYHPVLPPLRRQLLATLPLGRLAKYHVVYDTPFWRADGVSGNALFAGDAAVSAVFENTPPAGRPGVLFAFAGGDQASALRAMPAGRRRETVLAAFAEVVGERARHPREFLEIHWPDEHWTGGGPASCAPPGLLTGCGPVLRDRVGPIHWAGTETAGHWTGYLDGAVRSGERAADEALAITGRRNVTAESERQTG